VGCNFIAVAKLALQLLLGYHSGFGIHGNSPDFDNFSTIDNTIFTVAFQGKFRTGRRKAAAKRAMRENKAGYSRRSAFVPVPEIASFPDFSGYLRERILGAKK